MVTDEQKKEIKKRVYKIRKQKHLENFQKFIAENIDTYGNYDDIDLGKYQEIKRYTEE